MLPDRKSMLGDISGGGEHTNPSSKEISRALRSLDAADHRTIRFSNGTSVVVGVPLHTSGEGSSGIRVAPEPHVFTSSMLYIPGISYPTMNLYLKDITIILSHSRKDENRWVFENGMDLVGTVSDFNHYAEREDLPKIGAVISCNDGVEAQQQTRPKWLEQEGIIFAYAGTVQGETSAINGAVTLNIDAPYGFVNVDETFNEQTGISLKSPGNPY